MQKGGFRGSCNYRSLFFGTLFLALATLLSAGSLAAQTATGTVTGTVTDPKGLPMTDATVLVHNTDTGADQSVTTNDAGRYVVPQLQPGHYELSASKSGFATAEAKGLDVGVGQTITVDMPMTLATQVASVTVTAETPLIETEKTEQSQSISENLVGNLPTGSRRWQDFVLLTPGVTTDGTSGMTSFRGISGLYNNNSVDGANNSQAFFSESRGRASVVTYVYSADSIKEFQVSSSNYSAEFSQAVGGVVNAVTKSGTNQYHGDLFYNLRYPSLNALDPVAKASAATNGTIPTQTVHQQQQFGGSVGGPIIKDKLFLFLTYDGFRKVNPIQYTTSQTNPPISAFVCPATTFVSTTLCNNGKTFLENELGIAARDLKQDIGFGKLDYQLNSANHLSALFNLQDWGEPYGYNTSYTVSNGGKGNNGKGGTHERFFIASWDSTFSSNKLNELRFQWGRDFEFDSANEPGPFVNVGNYVEYGETSALPRPAFPDEHRYQVSDNFTFIKGAHTFKAGADINLIHELLINLFQGDGSYSYTSPVALPAAAGCPTSATNTEFCDWLVDVLGVTIPTDTRAGQHYSTFTQVTDPITHVGRDDFYDDDYGIYLQDTWKARRNLTVNLGVRYDLQHVPQPPSPNTGSAFRAYYTSTLNFDTNNIAPRLGVAWSINDKTVLRVGFGTFYGKTSNSSYYALRVENGIYQQTISGCSPTGSTAALRACAPSFTNVFFTPPGLPLAAPFPGAVTPTVGLPAPLPGASGAIHGMPPNFVEPVAQEGEVTLERQLPGKISFSASYLLTRGLHLPWDVDANVAPSTTTRSYDVLSSSGGPTTMTATVPFYTTLVDPTIGIVQTQYSAVNSWYNGMVLTARKPVGSGVELLLNYTFSKAMDDGETAGGATSNNSSGATFFGNDSVLDPYNREQDYARSDLDQRHRFVGSAVWTPLYAKDMSSKAARMALDGWSVSGILTAASGQPYTATIGTFTAAGAVAGGMTGAVIGTSASASGGRVSWLPRNSYNLPNFTNIDFRVARAFSIHERYQFEFRIDAFNLFNSLIVGQVNPEAYTESAPGGTGCAGHTNACLIPFSAFQAHTLTSSPLYGARQLQIGGRFSF